MVIEIIVFCIGVLCVANEWWNVWLDARFVWRYEATEDCGLSAHPETDVRRLAGIILGGAFVPVIPLPRIMSIVRKGTCEPVAVRRRNPKSVITESC